MFAARPFHPDEANQAFTTGRLLETGSYVYNPADHHGPVLYYAAVPVLRAAGAKTFAEMDGSVLRSVPLAFAVLALACVVLLPRGPLGFFRTWWGRLAALAFIATAPIFVYFSTFYIQEMLLAAFLALMLLAAARCAAAAGKARGFWAILFGVAAGLALATKETAVLAFAAAGAATLAVWRTGTTCRAPTDARTRQAGPALFYGVLALAAALAIAVLFFSSFGANLHGVYDAFITAPGAYLRRAVGSAASAGAADHVHPWWWYLRILFTWHVPGGVVYTEAALLVAAAFAFVWKPVNRWALFIAAAAAALLAAYSVIPYKTPWCMLAVVVALALAAALGVDAVAAAPGLSRTRRAALLGFLVLLVLAPHGFAVVDELRRPVSRTCPFAYAAALDDAAAAAALVEDVVRRSPEGSYAAVAVPPGDTWPLPWYLRRVPVGYWNSLDLVPAAADPVAVVVPEAESGRAAARFPSLNSSGIYGLRPGVLVTVLYRDAS